MANQKEVKELEVGPDGMHLPTSPLRSRIAECFASGMSRKAIATHLQSSYDYVCEALRAPDVKAHVARCRIHAAAQGKGQGIKPNEVKEWAEMAPSAQRFYEHMIELGFDVEQFVERKVGEREDGSPIMAESFNPDYGRLKGLGLKAAEEVVKRTWGNVPQRVDVDELPGPDKISRMTDDELVLYERELRRGTAPSLAIEAVKRYSAARAAEEAAQLQEADYELIEGEDLEDDFDDVQEV